MYYLRTRSAVDPLKGLGVSTTRTKPVPQEQDNKDEEEVKEENPTPTSNSLLSDNSVLEMVSQPTIRPDDSPFDCEGCGS